MPSNADTMPGRGVAPHGAATPYGPADALVKHPPVATAVGGSVYEPEKWSHSGERRANKREGAPQPDDACTIFAAWLGLAASVLGSRKAQAVIAEGAHGAGALRTSGSISEVKLAVALGEFVESDVRRAIVGGGKESRLPQHGRRGGLGYLDRDGRERLAGPGMYWRCTLGGEFWHHFTRDGVPDGDTFYTHRSSGSMLLRQFRRGKQHGVTLSVCNAGSADVAFHADRSGVYEDGALVKADVVHALTFYAARYKAGVPLGNNTFADAYMRLPLKLREQAFGKPEGGVQSEQQWLASLADDERALLDALEGDTSLHDAFAYDTESLALAAAASRGGFEKHFGTVASAPRAFLVSPVTAYIGAQVCELEAQTVAAADATGRGLREAMAEAGRAVGGDAHPAHPYSTLASTACVQAHLHTHVDLAVGQLSDEDLAALHPGAVSLYDRTVVQPAEAILAAELAAHAESIRAAARAGAGPAKPAAAPGNGCGDGLASGGGVDGEPGDAEGGATGGSGEGGGGAGRGKAPCAQGPGERSPEPAADRHSTHSHGHAARANGMRAGQEYLDRAAELLRANKHNYDSTSEVLAKQRDFAELCGAAREAAAAVKERWPTRPTQPAGAATTFTLRLSAARNRRRFEAVMKDVAKQTGLRLSLPGVKKAFRIAQKHIFKHGRASCDVLRALLEANKTEKHGGGGEHGQAGNGGGAAAAVVVQESTVLLDCLRHMLGRDDIEIVDFKDRMNHPTAGGWRDLLLLFRLKGCGDGHVCEVQLALHKLLVARTEMEAHEVYVTARHFLEMYTHATGVPWQQPFAANASRALLDEGHGASTSGNQGQHELDTTRALVAELREELEAQAATIARLEGELESVRGAEAARPALGPAAGLAGAATRPVEAAVPPPEAPAQADKATSTADLAPPVAAQSTAGVDPPATTNRSAACALL